MRLGVDEGYNCRFENVEVGLAVKDLLLPGIFGILVRCGRGSDRPLLGKQFAGGFTEFKQGTEGVRIEAEEIYTAKVQFGGFKKRGQFSGFGGLKKEATDEAARHAKSATGGTGSVDEGEEEVNLVHRCKSEVPCFVRISKA